jgi:hypothetical protein
MSEYSDYRADARILLEDMTPELATEFFQALEASGEITITLDDGFQYIASVEAVSNVRKI